MPAKTEKKLYATCITCPREWVMVLGVENKKFFRGVPLEVSPSEAELLKTASSLVRFEIEEK